MRWLRWGVGTLFILWLMVMARREASRRGRKSLAIGLPLLGGAAISFFLAISITEPMLSNIFVALSMLCIAAAIGIMIFQGFR